MTAPTTPTPADSTGIILTHLQTVIAALTIAGASAAATLASNRPTTATPCVDAVEVFYANERTINDTLLWVPPIGSSVRDSLKLIDPVGNDSIYFPFQPRIVRVCFPHGPVPNRPVLGT